VTIVLDDVGYSDLGCFGGEIRTPSIDGLAQHGLRYNHFDTKAVCSATRASLLTGRNCHTVNMPDVPDVAAVGGPGEFAADAFHIPRNAAGLAEELKRAGYATWAMGKWHLIPMDQLDEKSSQDCWPLQRGFDYFYGFARGWTDQYRPELVENNRYIHPELPADYHFSTDIVDRSLAMIDSHRARSPRQPFYLNLAFGAAHAPLQVPREYADRYDSIYSQGWDVIREQRFERMRQIGIIPRETVLPPRDADDRAWAQLSEDEKVVFARFMAVYAGFLEHADEQIGRLLSHLRACGLESNTLVVLLSDNGAASEAGQTGSFDGLYRPNKLTPAQERARLAELGTAKTEAEYPRPWAMACSAPLRRYKLWPYAGGVRTPLIVSWPGVIKDPGAVRHQFVDVIDIAPTLLEAAGTRFANTIAGVQQIPVAGRSFLATLMRPDAPPPRTVQYFELRGNRAVTSGPWRAVAMHECAVAYESDRWQLYNLAEDFSEARDVSAQHAAKLREMQELWRREWLKHNAQPLQPPAAVICTMSQFFDAPSSGPSDSGA
jgi:arylsulfatase